MKYAEVEGHSISEIFENVNLVLGRNATEEYLTEIKDPDVIHFATHAFYLPRPNEKFEINPLTLSGIALTGANLNSTTDRMKIGELISSDS